MVHVKHDMSFNSPVTIRSQSGDIDIYIMVLTSFYSTNLIFRWWRKKDGVNARYWDQGRQQKLIDQISLLHWVWLHLFIFPQGEDNKLENNEQQISF